MIGGLVNKLFYKQSGHRATTAHMQALYPFMSERGIGRVGTYLGTDHAGAPFSFDEFKFYDEGLLTGPNSVVLGEVGSAKSTNVKLRIWRGATLGRKAIVLDPKMEYGPMVEQFNRAAVAAGNKPDASIISLRPGGDVCLNPLESSGNLQSQQALAQAVVAAALSRPLLPSESSGVLRGLGELLEDHQSPTLTQLAAKLLDPTATMAARMRMNQDELRETLRDCAFALERLVEGDLKGMFDGPTSDGVSLDGTLVVIDLSAVDNSTALAVLMTCATAWISNRIAAERRTDDTTKRLLVVDEAWHILSDPMCAEWLQRGFKLSRSLGVAHVIVMHRLTDARGAGDVGSRTQALAEGLVADAHTKIVHRQDHSQVDYTRQVLGLTDTEAAWLPHLQRGTALWKIGDYSALVRITPVGIEWDIVNTDYRMQAAEAIAEAIQV